MAEAERHPAGDRGDSEQAVTASAPTTDFLDMIDPPDVLVGEAEEPYGQRRRQPDLFSLPRCDTDGFIHKPSNGLGS